MTVEEYKQLSTRDKIAQLRKCNGEHATLEELFYCDSCGLMLDLMAEEAKVSE